MNKLYNRPKTQGQRKIGSFSNDVEAVMEDVLARTTWIK